MRNLKRALSLTLASVMLLGMMVVGSSAKGYDDVTEDNNVEAIEVLQTIEVMVGDERGFGPERPVNRAEMAVVMGKLLSLDYNYYATSCPFNDVYDWARGYVGACYANKIVSGRGDGVYDPGATVTAVEAASMLMRALGYFQYANDVADGFELSTVRQGTKIGIFDGVGSSATAPMTRDQVAQMVLNALQSDVVEPDGNTINLTTPDGTVLTGKVNYVSVTRDEPYAWAIDDTRASSIGSYNEGWIVELGERLYNGDLKLHEYEDDTFMRPSRTWEYKGKEIGTYMKVENIRETYTQAVNARTLYDLLGRTNLEEYTFNYYEDGEPNDTITAAKILTRSTSDFKTTGRGVLTQVFVDVEARTIDITSINTYLAKATVDYSASTEKVTLEVYTDVTPTGTSPNVTIDTDEHDKVVSVADVDNITGLKKDDYVLVNVSGKDNSTTPVHNTLAGYDIVTVKDVEILSDTKLTKFSKDSDSDNKSNSNEALFKSVVAEGTEYKSAKRAYYSDEVLDLYDNDLLVNKTYNIYLDPYGNAIGIDLFSGEDNYVFITGVDLDSSNISLGTAKAAAIFVDGTMKTITVDVRDTNKNIAKVDSLNEGAGDSAVAKSYFEKWVLASGTARMDSITDKAFVVNRWYTYTVDANNEYTLNPATRMFTTEIPAGAAELDRTIKCNSVRIDEKASAALDNGGSYAINRYAANNDTARAFGNDNSVFIVVEADEKVTNSVRNVINDVAGVYTGVQNVEIEVNTSRDLATGKITGTELADQIYTLYDKNNYIIASVILGDAKGSNANYAFILTAGTSEELLADGTHQWEFDAVVDGKVTTLTARSKFSKTVMGLEPGHIQELRYSGEYVTGVKTPDDGSKYYTDPTSGKINKKDIYDVGHVSVDNKAATDTFTGAPDCTVSGVHTYGGVNINTARITTTAADDLRIVGRTMYLKPAGTAGDYGLTFVENAPAVVIQKTDGNTKKINCASVSEAIGMLGDPITTTSKKEFQGRIVAVLNSQDVAEWVVFISDTPVNSAGVSVPGGPADGASMPSPFWNGTAIEVPYYKTIPTSDALKTMIEPVTGPIKTMSFNMVVTEDGMYYPIALTEYIAIKIDGTPAKYVKVGVPHGDVTGLTNGTKYLENTKHDSSVDYTAANKKITVANNAVSQTDVELYTACKIDLENGVTAVYGTTAVNDNDYVAKGEEVTFSGVLNTGRHSYKVNDVTYGQAITGAVKPLTLTITGDTKVDEAASYRISILGKDLGEHAAGATVKFTSTAPKTALYAKKGTNIVTTAVDSISDSTSEWVYTVDGTNDAHTDGTITIVEAYTIAAQTGEAGIGSKISLSRKADGDANTTVADGTALVEVGTTVYVQGTATKGVMINPAVTNSGITGLTAEAVGTSTNKVYSFKMPAKAVSATTFCYDWYVIAAQTEANSTGITFSLDAEGTQAISPTTHVAPGTTVYATASAANKAITATDPTLTEVTAPAAGVKGVYSFTMGIKDVAATALTQDAP